MKIRLPKTRRFRVYIYIVSILLVLLAIDLSWVRIWRHITISPQTTYITAPLKPDGMPDYIQYLDDHVREGVTAENNAFIPFLEAITPILYTNAAGQPVIMTEYYTRLGLAPPKEPRRILSFDEFLKAKTPSEEYSDARSKEEDFVLIHPWSAAEHPDVAAWVGGNEKILSMMLAITSRTRWYVPVIRPPSDRIASLWIPDQGQSRALGHLVLVRAMREIHERRFAEAQADILACHRLARLQAQGWTLVNYLVALAIERVALRADAALAASPDLPAAQLRQFSAEWDRLPPWPSMDISVDFLRFGTLDSLIFLSQNIGETFRWTEETYGDLSETTVIPEWARAAYLSLRLAHFNAAMREVNAFYDQFIEAAKAPTAPQREDLASAMDEARYAYFTRYKSRLADPARQIAGWMPSFAGTILNCDAREMNAKLTRVALALAVYRADNDSYPDNLAALSPRYLSNLPEDMFSGQPLHYRKTDTGYVLYSVGTDRKDDGGKPPKNLLSPWNRKDDIVIQVPE